MHAIFSFARLTARLTCTAAAAALLLATTAAPAQTPATAAQAAALPFDIPELPLTEALPLLARQAGLQLAVSPTLLGDLRGKAVHGAMAPEAAAAELLRGSGLQARISQGVLGVEPATEPALTVLPAIRVRATAEQESATGPVAGYVAKRSAAGTKTDTPIVETPQSISVVTADRVEAIGATRLNEALAYTPGVSITTYGVDSRFDWISLRGFDAYSPGFYLDGLPLRNIGTWAVWKTDNFGAERIELLRGPASVLYGQSGPGGVVNVVSKRPSAEPIHDMQLQLGNHARKQLSGDFSGPVDADGQWLYRVTAVARDAELPAGGMPDDYVYLAPALTWKPSAGTSLTVLSHYLGTRAGSYRRNRRAVGSLVPTPAGTKIPVDLFTGEPGFDRFQQDQWTLGYQFEHRFDDTWTVRQNLRYGKLDVDYRQVTGSGYVSVNADPTDPANYRFITRNVFASREHASSLTVDNQLQAALRSGDWRHTVLFGIDHQRSRFDQVTASGSAPGFDLQAPAYGAAITVPAPYADAVTTATQTGVYVQDQVKWREHWTATVGGRYDRAESVVDSRLDGSSTRMPDEQFTTRAGLVYLHPSGWAPYLGYSESFVPTVTVDTSTGRALEPETGRQLEAGIRYQPAAGRDSYSAAVFDVRRQNYITYDSSFMPKQTGEVRVRGLELEATLRAGARTNVTVSYTYTPTADVTASVNASEVGKQLTAVPRHRGALWADHRMGGVKAGLGARYTGSNLGDGEMAPAKVPAYTVLDALVAYEMDRWSLALNVRNLADKTYLANCDAYGSCYYGEPRRITATARYRW